MSSPKNKLRYYRKQYELVCEVKSVRCKEALDLWKKIIVLENKEGL